MYLSSLLKSTLYVLQTSDRRPRRELVRLLTAFHERHRKAPATSVSSTSTSIRLPTLGHETSHERSSNVSPIHHLRVDIYQQLFNPNLRCSTPNMHHHYYRPTPHLFTMLFVLFPRLKTLEIEIYRLTVPLTRGQSWSDVNDRDLWGKCVNEIYTNYGEGGKNDYAEAPGNSPDSHNTVAYAATETDNERHWREKRESMVASLPFQILVYVTFAIYGSDGGGTSTNVSVSPSGHSLPYISPCNFHQDDRNLVEQIHNHGSLPGPFFDGYIIALHSLSALPNFFPASFFIYLAHSPFSAFCCQFSIQYYSLPLTCVFRDNRSVLST